MASDSRQLERVIAQQREDLDRNLEELVMKAKALTDWRTQVEAHPFGMLGLAIGGGAIVAILTRGRSRRRADRSAEPANSSRRPRGPSSLVQDVSSALGTVAAATALEFLADAVPGFTSHFRKHSDATVATRPAQSLSRAPVLDPGR